MGIFDWLKPNNASKNAANKDIESLIKALEDEKSDVRREAAEALGKIREAAVPALPALVTHLEDKAAGVRLAAANAIGEIGKSFCASPHLAVATLVYGTSKPPFACLIERVAKEEDPAVRQAMREAARTIGNVLGVQTSFSEP